MIVFKWYWPTTYYFCFHFQFEEQNKKLLEQMDELRKRYVYQMFIPRTWTTVIIY